jgi:PAS domain S-box-containing protein
MRNSRRIKVHSLSDLEALRSRIADLEKSEAECIRAENALRDSNELLEKFFSTVHVSIAYLDSDFNFIRVNRAFSVLLGREPEYYAGKNYFDLFPDHETAAILRRAVETGEPYSAHARPMTLPSNLGVTYWDWMLQPLTGASGKVEGILVRLIDVTKHEQAEEDLRRYRQHLEELVEERTSELTSVNQQLQREIAERKQVEMALREERDRAKKYLDIAGVILICIDRSQNVTLINKKGCEVLGYEEDEITGKNWFDNFVPESYRDERKASFDTYVNEKLRHEEEKHEGSVLTRDGKERLIDWHNTAIIDGAGNVIGTLGSGMDITERKQAEKALRENEEQYRGIFENSVTGIFTVSLEGTYMSCNPAGLAVLGYPLDEVIGVNYRKHVAPESWQMVQTEYNRLFRTGAPVRSIRYDVVTKRGGRRTIEGNVSLIREGDRIVGFQGTAIDITERKRAEEALRESEARYRQLCESLEETVKKKVAELEQAQRLAAIGKVVAVVAHELRSPLQNMVLGVETMRQELSGDKDKGEILDEIEAGVESLNNIIKDLLQYSKPISPAYSLCSVRDMVRKALSFLTIRLNGISVHLELEQEDRPILIDAEKMTRVFVNVITNAAEAMANGGTLTISSRFSESAGGDGALKLSITDTGCGIDEENLKRIYELFFTTKPRGTGLGISICKKIVEAHKGEFNIRSRPNEGTTIEITLPVSPKQGNGQ